VRFNNAYSGCPGRGSQAVKPSSASRQRGKRGNGNDNGQAERSASRASGNGASAATGKRQRASGNGPAATGQRGSEATRQRGSEAARQRGSEAARQRGSEAARPDQLTHTPSGTVRFLYGLLSLAQHLAGVVARTRRTCGLDRLSCRPRQSRSGRAQVRGQAASRTSGRRAPRWRARPCGLGAHPHRVRRPGRAVGAARPALSRRGPEHGHEVHPSRSSAPSPPACPQR
jgi:hypothetical protein